jgi:hypothetical protein
MIVSRFLSAGHEGMDGLGRRSVLCVRLSEHVKYLADQLFNMFVEWN